VRRSILIAVLAGTCMAAGGTAQAQQASAPIRLLVGFAPGGALDAVGRALADGLRAELNQPVIVENKPGAGQQLALNEIRRSKPDGLTLILANSMPFTVYPHIYKKLDFDPVKDFTPLGRVATFDLGITAGPAAPEGGINDFLAWAKANPGKADYGTSGAGTPGHFVGEMVSRATGAHLQHVAYRGGAPAMNDLLGGQIPVVADTILESLEMAKAGKVRILATSGATRTALTPEVPTLKESGIDVVVDAYIGLYGPANIPTETVRRITNALETAMRSTALQERITQFAYRPAYATPEAVVGIQAQELERWAAPIKAIGFTVD